MVDRLTARFGPPLLRWVAALLWLGNIAWKRPPDFGRSGDVCTGFCTFVAAGSDYSVLPGTGWAFEEVVGPNLAVFGLLTILAEGTIGALLAAGRLVRTAAVGGVALSFVIFAAVANAPDEWYWTYVVMMALHVAVLVTAPTAAAQSASVMAAVLVAFGTVMVVVHAGDGLTGTAFTFFDGSTPVPNDFARNLLGGSVAWGLVLVLLGALGAAVARRAVQRERVFGIALVAAGVVLALTYGDDGTIVGLGSTTSSAALLAATGLAFAITPPHTRPSARPAGDQRADP